MPVAINGIRLHDNLRQQWFSVYPERQLTGCTTGANACTIVFGGKYSEAKAGPIRGQLIRGDGVVLVDYTANVAIGETHVFELTFDMRAQDETFTVKLMGEIAPVGGALPPIPYPAQYTFNVAHYIPLGMPGVVPLPGEPLPPVFEGMPPLPTSLPIVTEIVNWVNKAGFPDFKLFNLSGVDFGNILGTVAKALGDTIAEPLKGLPNLVEVLGTLPSGLSTLLGSLASNLVSELFSTGSDLMSGRLLSTLAGTPESVALLGDLYNTGYIDAKNKMQIIANPENYVAVGDSPSTITNEARQQLTDTANIYSSLNGLNMIVSAASIGQMRIVADEIQMLEGLFGASGNIHSFYQIRQNIVVNKAVTKYFNAVWQPEIPDVNQLINMVVKEKMSLVMFKEYMLEQGFSEAWSQLIWDAHFRAPDLNDVLTAWRRGIIDETRVDELMILIDLDPTFKSVFDTRKYLDPPLMITRLMFETGAITAEMVPTYVHRLGYAPEFEAAISEFILHFQERRYRTRYITQLMTALAQNKVTEETVRTEVAAIGFTSATADLIVKTALLRATTLASTGAAAKEVALTLSELKKAYLEDIVTEEFLRVTMLGRGYALTDVQIVIDILNKDKAVETAGRRQVALTVAEMLSAWRFGVVDEETLRVNLLARGLDLNEVDILIETKRKSWGVGNIEQASS